MVLRSPCPERKERAKARDWQRAQPSAPPCPPLRLHRIVLTMPEYEVTISTPAALAKARRARNLKRTALCGMFIAALVAPHPYSAHTHASQSATPVVRISGRPAGHLL